MTNDEQKRVEGIRDDALLSTKHFSAYDDKDEITIRAQWMKFNDEERLFLLSLLDRFAADNAKLREQYEICRNANEIMVDKLAKEKKRAEAAIASCSGYCTTCAFVDDCAKHDNNDAAPSQWYYGDCEHWEWNDPTKEE